MIRRAHPPRSARPLPGLGFFLPERPADAVRFLLVAATLWLPPAQALPAGEEAPEITSLRFEGNAVLSTGELEAVITTRETPGFLNKFLHGSISEALGRKDEFFDPLALGRDLELLRTTYQDRGFFEAVVDSQLRYDADGREVEITIRIREGYRSRVDTLTYRGLDHIQDFASEEIWNEAAIRVGDPYDAGGLKGQVDLVLRVLRKAGYPYARFLAEDSRAVRRTSTGDFSVLLSFETGRQCAFGPVTILRERDEGPDDVADDVVFKHLFFTPGDRYDESVLIESERNLNRLGVFDVARIRVDIPPQESSHTGIPSTIALRQADKHELAPELILSDENGSFNIGTGLGYKHRNFLGEARVFSTRLRFRTQTIREFPGYFNLDREAIANAELTFELLQPGLFTNKIKGSWTFSLILDKQRPYLQFIIRNKFGVHARLAQYTNGYLDWSLERVSLEQNPNILRTASPTDLQQLRFVQRAQFNSILSFTMVRNKANDLFSPSAGFIHSMTVDESGLLPLLLERAQPQLPFTQFYRLILSGSWYNDLSRTRFAILALKLKGGIEGKYGETAGDPERTIPQTHRFYAGGAGSVRGWDSRRLIARGDPALELGGDLLFEAGTELRVNPFQALRDGFLNKLWTVLFLDAGNVWPSVSDLQLRTVALAAGVGIRYDTFFGAFRVDFGMRVYDPLRPEGSPRWITERRFFGETVRGGVFHFGIGHAF